MNYAILAKELDANAAADTTIVDLTNGVPFNFTAGPGAALTNFFRFSITNNPSLTNAAGVRFELYDLTGNGDLTLQTNAPPFGAALLPEQPAAGPRVGTDLHPHQQRADQPQQPRADQPRRELVSGRAEP